MRTNDRAQKPRRLPEVTVSVDGERWTQTANLRQAGRTDRVFQLTSDGRVVFGDGEHGARPPTGGSVNVSYRAGGGSAGNLQIAVTARWPLTRSRYIVTLDRQGLAVSNTGDDAGHFTTVKRVRYFEGQLLDAKDFRDEQQYWRQLHRRHNQLLHGWGIVTGLRLQKSAGQAVAVEPGLALDRLGRDVCLSDQVTVSITASQSPQFVIVSYRERGTDPVPIAGKSDEAVPSRVEEGASVDLAASQDIDDGVAIGRIVRGTSGWKVDRAFRPRRVRGR
jgi:hypothetical protein